MNKIVSIVEVREELRQAIDKFYNLCKADNEELLKQWLNNRNWIPFDSMGFEIGTKPIMNIKDKIRKYTTITIAEPTAKDQRLTGSTKKGFMPDGKRYITKGKTEDEIYEKITREYIKRQKKLKKKTTTADLLDAALAHKQKMGNQKDSTINIERQNYENLVRDSKLEAMAIEKIKFKDIEDFIVDELIPRYQARRRDNSKPSTSDVNKKLTVLRDILSYARREGYIEINPFVADKLNLRGVTAKPKTKNPEESIFTEEQEQLIINHCVNTYMNGRNRNTANLAIVLIALTGIRVGEAAALKWSDCFLNEADPYIHIQRQQDNANNITDVKCDSDAGRRHQPLPTQAVELLRQLRKDTKVISEWVFTQPDGTRKTKHQIAAALTNAIEHEPSIKKNKGKGTHAFRKSYCSELMKNGTDPETVRVLMGHKDLSTTLKYYTFNTSTLKESLKAVNRTFDSIKVPLKQSI